MREEFEQIIESLREPDDVKVGFSLTYDNLRSWLIRPVDKRGCGFNAAFVDRLIPMVLQNIIDGRLHFEVGKHAFELYCKNRCFEFEEALINETAKKREDLFQKEFLYQQQAGLKLLAKYRRIIKWLSIFMGLLALERIMELAQVELLSPLLEFLGGF